MSFPVELVLLAGGGEEFSAFKKQIKLPFAPFPGLKLIAGWYAVTNASGITYPDQVEFHVRDVEFDTTAGVFFCFDLEGEVDGEISQPADQLDS